MHVVRTSMERFLYHQIIGRLSKELPKAWRTNATKLVSYCRNGCDPRRNPHHNPHHNPRHDPHHN